MLRFKQVVFALFSPSILLAQEVDSTSNILPIEEVIVTGQFQPTSLKNSVFKVRTIDKNTILRRATTDMTTLLNTELGVRFSNDLTLGESDIQLMGVSGQNVKVLLDGIPLIDRGSTKQSLSQIDLNTIERIEIVEGPVSVMYGTDALAGVINIITHNPGASKKQLSVTARILEETVSSEYKPINAEGKHNAHVGFQYQNKDWSLQWNGSRNNFGGYQGNSTGRSLQWQPKDQWLSSARFGLDKEKWNASYSINYTNEDLFTPGSIGANYKYVDKNYITDRFNHQLQGQYKIQKNISIHTSLSYQDYKRSTVTKLFDLNTQGSQLTTGSGEQDVSKFNQVFARVHGYYNPSNSLGILVGFEYDYDHGSGARIDNNASITDFAAILSTEYKPVSWINLRPGVRFIHNSIYNAPLAVPSLNAKVNLATSCDLRLGYAMGFRAPSLRELYFTFHDSNHAINGNTNLKAEHNQNFNVNVNYNKQLNDNQYISSSISGFYNDFKNLITIGQDQSNSAISTYLNIGTFKTMGGTWENTLKSKQTTVGLGFNYVARLNTVYAANPNLGKYFWTPEINGTISQDFPKWHANVNAYYKFYGKRPSYQTSGTADLMEVHQAEQHSYHQLDISVNKQVYSLFTIQAGVRNLTNTTNVLNTASEDTGAHATSSSSIPVSYGRSVFFGLLYQFNK